MSIIKSNFKLELAKINAEAWIECRVTMDNLSTEIEVEKIPNAIKYSIDSNSDWPIGILLPENEKSIVAKNENEFSVEIIGDVLNDSYDYTYYHKNGTIYFISTLKDNTEINYEYRLKRITELLLFIKNYYTFWAIQKNCMKIEIMINKPFKSIHVEKSFDKWFYNLREESLKIIQLLFDSEKNNSFNEIHMEKWMVEYFNSRR